MRPNFCRALVLLSLIATNLRPARGADLPKDITKEQVQQSIQGGVAFLKSQQNKINGGWSEMVAHPGGVSALVTLALLSAGEDPKSKEMQRALDYLQSLGKPSRTYVSAVQTMAFCAADPKKYQLQIRQNTEWLQSIQVRGGDRKGSWGYSGGGSDHGSGDNSNTQFAILALHEAERAGVKVSDETWQLALDYWLNSKNPDGGWGYQPGNQSIGSMTCAGITSVIIASGKLDQGASAVNGGAVHCCGATKSDDVVERALEWLGREFTVAANPRSPNWLLYYLYGVERVGRMSGRRFFAGDKRIDGRRTTVRHDWYREGSAWLVSNQDPLRRYWKGANVSENDPVLSTSFALLFLSKGRRPVVIAKAKYGADDNWDLHTGGVPNLARRIEQRWRRDLTWQTTDLAAASVEDLLQSPVLFLSGRDGLPITREQKENLKQYIDQGGFIFAEACDGNGCDGKAFDRQFRALMDELFPQSQLRLLPPDHPVWFAEEKVDPEHMRPLYGVDACCRTSVVYCPQNLSCYWELYKFERATDYPAAVQKEIESVLKIGENVVTYATNRELKDKLDRPQITVSIGNDQLTRGTLFVPKLSHGGGSDDAPNALANLLNVVSQQVQLPVSPTTRLVAPTDEKIFNYPVLFMHGRRSFRFSAAERKAIATYIERGGFLFADAICANPQFTESFRNELKVIFPDAKLVRIPPTHPIFTQDFRGYDITTVTLRDPQTRTGDDPLTSKLTKTAPLLEGLEIDGRWAVIFSPYDLSCALENQTSLECKGYTKQDAARIGSNVLLYSLQQ